ncbi:hypothetical protein [Kitasatospora sp. NPDC094011]
MAPFAFAERIVVPLTAPLAGPLAAPAVDRRSGAQPVTARPGPAT